MKKLLFLILALACSRSSMRQHPDSSIVTVDSQPDMEPDTSSVDMETIADSGIDTQADSVQPVDTLEIIDTMSPIDTGNEPCGPTYTRVYYYPLDAIYCQAPKSDAGVREHIPGATPCGSGKAIRWDGDGVVLCEY